MKMMSVKPPALRLFAACSSSVMNRSLGSVMVPALVMWPRGGSQLPSGTYVRIGATRALPSARAILSVVYWRMNLCSPITMCGPFCSVPAVAMITDFLPPSMSTFTSSQVSSSSSTVSGGFCAVAPAADRKSAASAVNATFFTGDSWKWTGTIYTALWAGHATLGTAAPGPKAECRCRCRHNGARRDLRYLVSIMCQSDIPEKSAMRRLASISVLTTLLSAVLGTGVQAQDKTPDYHRADVIRTAARYVFGTSAAPRILEDSARFWYISSSRNDRGVTYVVDPRAATRRPLFDNTRMAAALSIAADTVIDSGRLPTFTVADTARTIEVRMRRKMYRCAASTYVCEVQDTLVYNMNRAIRFGPDYAVRSPDKKWDVFLYNYNLYVRPAM